MAASTQSKDLSYTQYEVNISCGCVMGIYAEDAVILKVYNASLDTFFCFGS